MGPDDEICLCFHVTRRKVENYLRVEKPKRAGMLSECFGAGTGCGWCRPYLRRLFEAAVGRGDLPEIPEMTPEEYARQREQYRSSRNRDRQDIDREGGRPSGRPGSSDSDSGGV